MALYKCLKNSNSNHLGLDKLDLSNVYSFGSTQITENPFVWDGTDSKYIKGTKHTHTSNQQHLSTLFIVEPIDLTPYKTVALLYTLNGDESNLLSATLDITNITVSDYVYIVNINNSGETDTSSVTLNVGQRNGNTILAPDKRNIFIQNSSTFQSIEIRGLILI